MPDLFLRACSQNSVSVGVDKLVIKTRVTILTASVQSQIKQCALLLSHLICQSSHAP